MPAPMAAPNLAYIAPAARAVTSAAPPSCANAGASAAVAARTVVRTNSLRSVRVRVFMKRSPPKESVMDVDGHADEQCRKQRENVRLDEADDDLEQHQSRH